MNGSNGSAEHSCALSSLTARRLERDVCIEGHAFRAGTEVYVDPDSNNVLVRAILMENHTLGGLECRGFTPAMPPDGGWTFYTPDEVLFHKDGSLERVVLAKDQTIRGIPCKGDTRVSFFADGSLARFTLGSDATIKGIAFAKGTVLQLRETGALFVASHLSADLVVGDWVCKAESDVHFHASGHIETITLAKDAEYRELRLPAGAHVRFTADGAVLDLFSPTGIERRGSHVQTDGWVRLTADLEIVESPLARSVDP